LAKTVEKAKWVLELEIDNKAQTHYEAPEQLM